jgi:hypothetical protein
MAVIDAFRPQAIDWLKFLGGMDPSFVLRPVGKVAPKASHAQLDPGPNQTSASRQSGEGLLPLPCTPPQNFGFPSADYRYGSMQSEVERVALNTLV